MKIVGLAQNQQLLSGGFHAVIYGTNISGCENYGEVRTGAATTPGYALTHAYNRKVQDDGEL